MTNSFKTKKCTRCGQIKNIEQFYLKNKEKPYRVAHCIDCAKQIYQQNSEKWRARQRETYAKPEVRAEYLARAKHFRQKKIDWLLAHLGTDKLKCDRCRYKGSFAAIQFHHTDPSQKENSHDNFSNWLRKLSFKAFQKKILETEFITLCANCHAELHAGLWEYGK